MHVMCKYRYTTDITVKLIYICKRATKMIPQMRVFRNNTSHRSITDQAFSIYQTLEGRQLQNRQAVYQPLTDFSVAYDSSRESFLCNMKQVRLITTHKDKSIPLQDQTVPGGWGSQISRQSAHEGGKVANPTHRPPLPPGNITGTHFC
jgi:hypothetical protein